MVHGAVVRPPGPGAALERAEEGSVRGLPGFIRLVTRGNFVGVVCEKPWQAVQAARALKVTWRPGPPLPRQDDFYAFMRRQPARDTFVVDSGDVERMLAGAAAVVRATYLHPYQMHGSMGSSCAVADVRNGQATIWSGTQSAYPTRSTVAMLLDLPPERVRVVFVRGSGCYGLNGADTVSFDAALLSQAVGRPVRVQLSRRDEMAWENYGYAYVIDLRVGVDASGAIVCWDQESWYPTRGGRPGYSTPGNVVTGVLAGFAPVPFSPRTPAPPPASVNNGSNAAPSYVAGCVGGRCGGTGAVRSERVLTHAVASPFFTGPLRSPSRLQNTFAHESFMDELAARAKADPVEYRLRHLRDPRLIEVVRAAAKAAGWQAGPSPAPGASSPRAWPRAWVRDPLRGRQRLPRAGRRGGGGPRDRRHPRDAVRLVAGLWPDPSPDGMRNQIEGGALQGLSRALGEVVTWDARPRHLRGLADVSQPDDGGMRCR